MVDQGDFESSRQVLQNQFMSLQFFGGLVGQDDDLALEMNQLNESISNMNEQGYDKASRKKMSYNAYQQKRGRGRRNL